jgi:hypothetical protein
MNHYDTGNFGENWFNYPDFYKKIVEQYNNAHFVEIGCWKGRSASFMCVEIIKNNKNIKFDCIDTWRGSEEHQNNLEVQNDTLYNIFLENMKPVESYYTAIRSKSVDASKLYSPQSLDFIFIDGDHSHDAVIQDILSWLPKVKSGGILAGHDYPTTHGVKSAVDEIICKKYLQTADTNVWYVEVNDANRTKILN